jgi:hypothetical protein
MAQGANPYTLIYDGRGRSDILTYTATSTQGVTKGLQYKFKVQAINAIGTSSLSASMSSLAAVVPTSP